MTHTTMTYVPGVVRCEDLEATLLAAAAMQFAMIVVEDPTEVYVVDDAEGEDPYEEDYDQEYEYYLEYMDYLEQSYD